MTRDLQRPLLYLAVVMLLAMTASLIIAGQVVARERAAQSQQDYATCQTANSSREGLRRMVAGQREIVDHIAPEQQPDLSGLTDPQLRQLAALAQANNRLFRQQQLAEEDDELHKFAPRDCDAERRAAG